MIQCDICLCWQHGLCLNIYDEDQVPDKHVCETCRNPPAGRSSARYALDHDWLKEGKLPTIKRVPSSEVGIENNNNAFKKLSELMSDLSSLNKVLHALRVKLQVASQSNNGKVFMWSMLWDSPTSIQAASSQSHPDVAAASTTTATSTSFDLPDDSFVVSNEQSGETNFGKFDPQAVIDKLKYRLGSAATAAGGDPFSNSIPLSSTTVDFSATTPRNNFCSPSSNNSHHQPHSNDEDSHNLWPQFSLTFEQQQQQQQPQQQQQTSESTIGGSLNSVPPTTNNLNCDDVSVSHQEPKQIEIPLNNEFSIKKEEEEQVQPPITNGNASAEDDKEAEVDKNEQFDPESLEQSKKKPVQFEDSGKLAEQTETFPPTLKSENGPEQQPQQQHDHNHHTEVDDQVNHLEGVGSEEVAGDDPPFDPSLIPTFSEVAQLLPSVIEAMGSSGAGNGSESPPPHSLNLLPPPPPPRVLIQEPKRLDRDECRLNLLDHISSVQNEVELRLDYIESSLKSILDEGALIPLPQTKETRSLLTTILRDLGTARSLMWSLK